MKEFIVLLILGFALSLTFITVSVGWDCPPKRCTFDLDCGIGCFCYKAKYSLDGVCVPKR